jgi:membrane associated rhomboid family serine protease
LNDNSSTISTKSKAASKSKAKDKKASSVNKTATGGTKVSGSHVKTSASKMSATMSKYKAILPLTRLYITLVTIFTIIGTILGDELTQALLALDPTRFIYGLELWRPLTAACFLGKPSIGWLFSTYFLYEYGSSLERSFGTAQHFVFLLGQVIFLSIASMLLGIPFFANSVITAMLHVLSRSMPHQKVKWLIFTVPYWSLPYGNMASDVLQSGSAASAVPHILGILSGHFYYFHKFIWPKTGGEDWLAAPQFLVNWLDPTSNQLSVSKKSIENALKKRKKGQGRKLGN